MLLALRPSESVCGVTPPPPAAALFQLHDLEYHDGDLDTQYSLGHQAGNVIFQHNFSLNSCSFYVVSLAVAVLLNLHQFFKREQMIILNLHEVECFYRNCLPGFYHDHLGRRQCLL